MSRRFCFLFCSVMSVIAIANKQPTASAIFMLGSLYFGVDKPAEEERG